MTFTGVVRRLVFAFWEKPDLDMDTRRENQFGCSEPWQTRVQHVLEGNKRSIVQNFIPVSLFHIIFHLQVWWSVEESGYPKVYNLFRTMKFSKLLKLSNLMIQKWNKSIYGLTHMGKMLCNSGLHYYVTD